MSFNDHDTNTLLRDEEIKTLKSRRRLYTGVFIIILAVLFYLAGQVLNILASPIAIVVWTTIIVFCLKGPVNNLEKKGFLVFGVHAFHFCSYSWRLSCYVGSCFLLLWD